MINVRADSRELVVCRDKTLMEAQGKCLFEQGLIFTSNVSIFGTALQIINLNTDLL
jgi:hypothetical protein